jgi:hypothetical protein
MAKRSGRSISKANRELIGRTIERSRQSIILHNEMISTLEGMLSGAIPIDDEAAIQRTLEIWATETGAVFPE